MSPGDYIFDGLMFLQNAAGALNYLSGSVVPQLRTTLPPDEAPLEFTEPFIRALEFLMLAQAQECVWQRAVMGEIFLCAVHWWKDSA